MQTKKRDRIAHLASTFGGKEAVFKAFKTGITECKKVEILRNESGAPYVRLREKIKKLFNERGLKKILISLSYTNKIAVAFAILVN